MSAPDFFTAATVAPFAHTAKPSETRGRPTAFSVIEGEDVREITVRGRDAWALSELIAAGATGCTPLEHVGPRWSHYVFKLRRTYRLNVESVEEQHGGEFSGRHVRYVLRSRVRFADPADAARHGGDR